MTDRQLADLLGIHKSRVCQLKRQGMPTHSAEAAKAWRDQFVRPRVNHRDPAEISDRAVDTALELVNALGLAADAAIKAGVFDRVEPDLRTAIAALPEQALDRMLLSMPVWDALCADRLPLSPPRSETGHGPW